MTELTLSDEDRYTIEHALGTFAIDKTAERAFEQLEELILQKDATFAILERKFVFAKGQISMMENKIKSLEGKHEYAKV